MMRFFDLIRSIESYDDFSQFVGILYEYIDVVAIDRASSSADDLVGAFAESFTDEIRSDEYFSLLKNDLSRVAWVYWISLSRD